LIQNKIQQYRQIAGLSQTKLACKAGIAASTLSAFENRKVAPWPKARKAIAKALHISEDDLFGTKKGSTAVSLEAPAVLSSKANIDGGESNHVG